MKTVNVQYGGFESEKKVEENLYDVIYQRGRQDIAKELCEFVDCGLNLEKCADCVFLYGYDEFGELVPHCKLRDIQNQKRREQNE